jgi:tRNA(fMet)-specific endonuclease VapC
MSGKKYFLDTNAAIELLKGNKQLINILTNVEYLACSIITVLEFLSFSNISENDKCLFKRFLQRIEVIDLTKDDSKLIDNIIKIRKVSKIKLPDAIILAMTKKMNSALLTADKQLLNYQGIKTENYIE